jgi:hypothetical protein
VLVFNIVFEGFWRDFGEVLEAKMNPKIDFSTSFWRLFFVPSILMVFLMHFDVCFNARILNFIAPVEAKRIFLRFGTFGTCSKNACKMHPKKHGF